MDIPQSYQTVAEISIAFAGFSGLVVAFRRHRGPLSHVEKYRLQILLVLSFGAMMLSFLPELLSIAGLAASSVWRLSSAGLAGWSLVFVAWWVWRSRAIKREVPEIFSGFAFARMCLGHITVIVLQLMVVLAFIREAAPATYLVGLIWYLVHCAQQFARMMFIQPRAPD